MTVVYNNGIPMVPEGGSLSAADSAVATKSVPNAAGATAQIEGPIAHDSAIGTSRSVRTAGRARSSNVAAVASDDVADFVTTVVGAQIVKNYSIPEADWSYAAAASGIVNTTTAVAIKAAAGAGLRNYLTGISIQTAVLGAATELAIRDGAGTVLWRSQLQVTELPLTDIQFINPLKSAANSLLEVVTLTAVTGGVYVNAQGYVAP